MLTLRLSRPMVMVWEKSAPSRLMLARKRVPCQLSPIIVPFRINRAPPPKLARLIVTNRLARATTVGPVSFARMIARLGLVDHRAMGLGSYVPNCPEAKYASTPLAKPYCASYRDTFRECVRSASVQVWKKSYGFSKYSGGRSVFSTRFSWATTSLKLDAAPLPTLK